MRIAAQCPYHTWFERVYCHRFDPGLLRNDDARWRAYCRRVQASARLYFSFEKHGFLPDHKITLRSGRRILASDSGKPVSARVFAGDGCHRLALLLKQGALVLKPGQYVVKVSTGNTIAPSTSRRRPFGTPSSFTTSCSSPCPLPHLPATCFERSRFAGCGDRLAADSSSSSGARPEADYSTVTLLARLRGLSTSVPLATAA
jgi:hypothetical protein